MVETHSLQTEIVYRSESQHVGGKLTRPTIDEKISLNCSYDKLHLRGAENMANTEFKYSEFQYLVRIKGYISLVLKSSRY